MSEYVCETTDDYPDVPWGDDDYSDTVERRERVVRCRDCIHFRPDKPKTSAPSRCTGVFTFVHPDPDGFCAWGMARKRGDRE